MRFEIITVLILKLLLLWALWLICFSHPIDKNLTPEIISAHLFKSLPTGEPA